MENKKEQDILLVRDEKTGELGVVSGLTANGTPRRVPAQPGNTGDFLKFDRHGDVLDNFFMNFFRQCKEPKRFGFYRVAAEQADKLLDVMKELLKDPDANRELLAPHKIDTSSYEKKVSEEHSYPIDEGKIRWQELEEQWGIKRDTLENSGALNKMLRYGKSDLVKYPPLSAVKPSNWKPAFLSVRTKTETSDSFRTSSGKK